MPRGISKAYLKNLFWQGFGRKGAKLVFEGSANDDLKYERGVVVFNTRVSES